MLISSWLYKVFRGFSVYDCENNTNINYTDWSSIIIRIGEY